MAEPFKNLFSEKVIRDMALHFVRVAPDFDGPGFVAFATAGLDGLELKQRSNQITEGLQKFLPGDFRQAVEILLASLDPVLDFSISEMEQGTGAHGIRGWPVMAMADYVAWNGQDDLQVSMQALRQMTMRSSSEMAIRYFIRDHEEPVMAMLGEWARDENYHVRRLVSEGTRPRLPWAMQLTGFVADPSPVLPLLEVLKDDPEEYVRRSVANNLNDISKDHPDLVAELAVRWMRGASPDRVRLVRHGLRSLIKQGHAGALAALGYGPAQVDVRRFEVLTPVVEFGGALEFALDIGSAADADQPLVIDYVVHHMRANGRTSPKVFKWKNVTLKAGKALAAERRHSIRPITTRRYYSGRHRVEIAVNGAIICGGEFELNVPEGE